MLLDYLNESLLLEAQPLDYATLPHRPAWESLAWSFDINSTTYELRAWLMTQGIGKNYREGKPGAIAFAFGSMNDKGRWNAKLKTLPKVANVAATIAEIVANELKTAPTTRNMAVVRFPGTINIGAATKIADRYIKKLAPKFEVIGSMEVPGTNYVYLIISRKNADANVQDVFGVQGVGTIRELVQTGTDEAKQDVAAKLERQVKRMSGTDAPVVQAVSDGTGEPQKPVKTLKDMILTLYASSGLEYEYLEANRTNRHDIKNYITTFIKELKEYKEVDEAVANAKTIFPFTGSNDDLEGMFQFVTMKAREFNAKTISVDTMFQVFDDSGFDDVLTSAITAGDSKTEDTMRGFKASVIDQFKVGDGYIDSTTIIHYVGGSHADTQSTDSVEIYNKLVELVKNPWVLKFTKDIEQFQSTADWKTYNHVGGIADQFKKLIIEQLDNGVYFADLNFPGIQRDSTDVQMSSYVWSDMDKMSQEEYDAYVKYREMYNIAAGVLTGTSTMIERSGFSATYYSHLYKVKQDDNPVMALLQPWSLGLKEKYPNQILKIGDGYNVRHAVTFYAEWRGQSTWFYGLSPNDWFNQVKRQNPNWFTDPSLRGYVYNIADRLENAPREKKIEILMPLLHHWKLETVAQCLDTDGNGYIGSELVRTGGINDFISSYDPAKREMEDACAPYFKFDSRLFVDSKGGRGLYQVVDNMLKLITVVGLDPTRLGLNKIDIEFAKMYNEDIQTLSAKFTLTHANILRLGAFIRATKNELPYMKKVFVKLATEGGLVDYVAADMELFKPLMTKEQVDSLVSGGINKLNSYLVDMAERQTRTGFTNRAASYMHWDTAIMTNIQGVAAIIAGGAENKQQKYNDLFNTILRVGGTEKEQGSRNARQVVSIIAKNANLTSEQIAELSIAYMAWSRESSGVDPFYHTPYENTSEMINRIQFTGQSAVDLLKMEAKSPALFTRERYDGVEPYWPANDPDARKALNKTQAKAQLMVELVDIVFEALAHDPNSVDEFFEAVDPFFQKRILEAASALPLIQKDMKNSTINMFADPSYERILAMFKFNGISIGSLAKNTGIKKGKKEKLSEFMNRVKSSDAVAAHEPLIKEVTSELTKSQIHEMNKNLVDVYHAGKHGDVYPIIHRVFDVHLPDDEYQAFLAEQEQKGEPYNKKIIPAFHGTGGIAANMILRYGFKVMPSSDGATTGRMLGNGIYFTNKIDKALLYVSNKGYGKQPGSRGYVMVMDSVLGEKSKDYKEAGTGNDSIRSPEWCVFSGRRQLKIFRAYEIELNTRAVYNKHMSSMNESNEMKSFNNMLTEAKISDKYYLNMIFSGSLIPVKRDGMVEIVDAAELSLSGGAMVETGVQSTIISFPYKDQETRMYYLPKDLQGADRQEFWDLLDMYTK